MCKPVRCAKWSKLEAAEMHDLCMEKRVPHRFISRAFNGAFKFHRSSSVFKGLIIFISWEFYRYTRVHMENDRRTRFICLLAMLHKHTIL